jgi:hypothetical protein
MDLNDIWQEHKVWILSVLAGVVVFFIADNMITNHFGIDAKRSQIGRLNSKIKSREYYDRTTLAKARDEEKRLDTALARAKDETIFRVGDEFTLEGKGDPSLHYLQLSSEKRNQIRSMMDSRNVEFLPLALGLPKASPTDPQELARMLRGLDLVDDAMRRLVAASDEVEATMPDQIDLVGLRKVSKINIRLISTEQSRRRNNSDMLGERISVSMEFESDGVTLERFMHSLSAKETGDAKVRPLLLSSLRTQSGDEPGEPMLVKCEFLVLSERGS